MSNQKESNVDVRKPFADVLQRVSENKAFSDEVRIAARYAASHLRDGDSEKDNEEVTIFGHKRGDIVKNNGDFYLLLSSYANQDGDVCWDMMCADGTIGNLRYDCMDSTDYHLDLDVCTVNGVGRFLSKLEDMHGDK